MRRSIYRNPPLRFFLEARPMTKNEIDTMLAEIEDKQNIVLLRQLHDALEPDPAGLSEDHLRRIKALKPTTIYISRFECLLRQSLAADAVS